MSIPRLTLLLSLISPLFLLGTTSWAQPKTHPDLQYAEATLLQQKANGFKGIWYMNQPSNDEYAYKYSGGMATYPANHRPFAIYAPQVNKTFFCYGGSDDKSSTLYHNVSYYDHTKGKLANPTMVLDKKTTDAHDNPVLSIDEDGYIWLFSTSHGRSRPSYISKSKKPYQIDQFDTIQATELVDGQVKPFNNFSYFQVYYMPKKGFIALFTKYNAKGQRIIGFNTSRDGHSWGAWQVLAHIEEGHYQVSAERNGKIGVAFDYHPKGKGLNYRTNLYYLESADFGKTWTTASGIPVSLPIRERQNAALVHDYSTEHLNSYLLDIDLDEQGKPFILTLTSKGYEAGPKNAPRNWTLSTFNGQNWTGNVITQSDSNYDMGSLYLDHDTITLIGPTIDGPQAFNPGGEVAMWRSSDKGKNWAKLKQLTTNSKMNHNYIRKPRYAHPDFFAVWADGNARKPSISYLYYMDKKGNVYQMPRSFKKKLTKASLLNQTP